MKIRQFVKEDVYQILAIQEKCREAADWLAADYLRLGEEPGGLILVAELGTMEPPPKILGFAAFHRVIDEAEVQNIAVHPEHRHQGVGRALLEAGSKRLLEAGAKRIILEVRASNKQALELYFSMGFGMRLLRKDYYRDPQEDALVLARELFPPAVVPSAP
jgi:ribosomal-protein-alanine N-acetyltransferase